MNEFDIIRRLAEHIAEQPGTALGIGDDAALLDPDPSHQNLIETCEIVSFDDAVESADSLFRVEKAFDSLAERLKSAGCRPRWLLTSVALIDADPQHVTALEGALTAGCRRHRIQLIGGDLTRGHPSLTLRMLGTRTNS